MNMQTIYFGVEDDGAISGLRLTRAQRDAVRLAVDKTVSSFRCGKLAHVVENWHLLEALHQSRLRDGFYIFNHKAVVPNCH